MRIARGICVSSYADAAPLDTQSLWLDEAHSVVQAQRWRQDIWIHDARTDPNPPLYFTVLKFWMLAFGTSEAAVRSLSVVCGKAAIVSVYLFGRAAGGAPLGLAAAALAATSPWLVIYSRDAREGPIQPSLQWSYPVIAPDELAHRLASHRRFWLVVRHQPPDAAEGPVGTGIAYVVGRLMREAPAAVRHQHGRMLELYLFDRDRTR